MKPHDSFIRSEAIPSIVTPVSDGSITLSIGQSRVHNFAGIVFFNEAEGITPVQPSSGTITFTVKLVVQPHDFQDVPSNEINATAVDQVSWAANTTTVKATFDSIVGATHAKMIWSGNSA